MPPQSGAQRLRAEPEYTSGGDDRSGAPAAPPPPPHGAAPGLGSASGLAPGFLGALRGVGAQPSSISASQVWWS